MKIALTTQGLEIEGIIENSFLESVLRESSQGRSIEEAFLEIIELGAKVRDVIQTSAATQVIQQSVTTVSEKLSALENEHEEFLTQLMAEIRSEDQTSDLSLVAKLTKWRSEFDQKLAQEFNADSSTSIPSKIKTAIDDYLKNRDATLASLLSLTETGDTLENRPLKAVYDQINQLILMNAEAKGEKKGRSRASAKGKSFEAAVFDIVLEISKEFNDIADDVGRQAQIGLDGNDEGDIIVDFDFGANDGRLVIECKHHGSPKGIRELQTELKKGFSNRGADYGILITNESGYKLGDSHPFWQDWDGSKAILVIEDDLENIDVDKIRFAYLIARARAKDFKSGLSSEAMSMVNEKIGTISTNFGRISAIKGNKTNIESALLDLEGNIKFLEDNVGKELSSLVTAIEEAHAKDANS
jgi:hypothetical protein